MSDRKKEAEENRKRFPDAARVVTEMKLLGIPYQVKYAGPIRTKEQRRSDQGKFVHT